MHLITEVMKILNAVVDLEVVPEELKCGVTWPIYKGGGKDPLKVDSYREITLASMVSKVLEFLLLGRLELLFMEACLPHVNQSTYRKAVSCDDAIFATQEVVANYLRGGNRVYIAFDSIEYPLLLEKLFDVGVNGKMWRLLKSLYDGFSCKERMQGILSEIFGVERGVK